MDNKWDDFHENMGDEQAALHMSGAFDSEVGHDHDSTLPGRGAPIKSTVDQTLAGGANTGTNNQILSWIVRQIKAITGNANWYDTIAKSWKDAFEPDGVTAKNATHAARAAIATLAEAAKADVRFTLPFFGKSEGNIGAQQFYALASLHVNVPNGKILKLKRVRYSSDDAYLRTTLRVFIGSAWVTKWIAPESGGSPSRNDVVLDITLATGTGGNIPLEGGIGNIHPSSAYSSGLIGGILELAIE